MHVVAPAGDRGPTLDIEALGRGETLILDAVLGPATCEGIWTWAVGLHEAGALTPAGVGRSGERREAVRSDSTRWVDAEPVVPALVPLLERFHAIGGEVSRYAFLGLRRFELQLAAYEREGHYTRHLDAFRSGGKRRLTAIYYPNVSWRPGDGGELEVYRGETASCVDPRADRMVIFLSDRVEHAVRPVIRGPRVAMTAWYRG